MLEYFTRKEFPFDKNVYCISSMLKTLCLILSYALALPLAEGAIIQTSITVSQLSQSNGGNTFGANFVGADSIRLDITWDTSVVDSDPATDRSIFPISIPGGFTLTIAGHVVSSSNYHVNYVEQSSATTTSFLQFDSDEGDQNISDIIEVDGAAPVGDDSMSFTLYFDRPVFQNESQLPTEFPNVSFLADRISSFGMDHAGGTTLQDQIGTNNNSGFFFQAASVSIIPEPSSIFLALCGVVFAVLRRRPREH